jgi:hypothetical protein
MILKVYCKISVSLRLVQNLKILDLAMAKVEKVIIAVTYFKLSHVSHVGQAHWGSQPEWG